MYIYKCIYIYMHFYKKCLEMNGGNNARRREADLSGALLSAPDKLLPPESCFCICHI